MENMEPLRGPIHSSGEGTKRVNGDLVGGIQGASQSILRPMASPEVALSCGPRGYRRAGVQTVLLTPTSILRHFSLICLRKNTQGKFKGCRKMRSEVWERGGEGGRYSYRNEGYAVTDLGWPGMGCYQLGVGFFATHSLGCRLEIALRKSAVPQNWGVLTTSTGGPSRALKGALRPGPQSLQFSNSCLPAHY